MSSLITGMGLETSPQSNTTSLNIVDKNSSLNPLSPLSTQKSNFSEIETSSSSSSSSFPSVVNSTVLQKATAALIKLNKNLIRNSSMTIPFSYLDTRRENSKFNSPYFNLGRQRRRSSIPELGSKLRLDSESDLNLDIDLQLVDLENKENDPDNFSFCCSSASPSSSASFSSLSFILPCSYSCSTNLKLEKNNISLLMSKEDSVYNSSTTDSEIMSEISLNSENTQETKKQDLNSNPYIQFPLIQKQSSIISNLISDSQNSSSSTPNSTNQCSTTKNMDSNVNSNTNSNISSTHSSRNHSVASSPHHNNHRQSHITLGNEFINQEDLRGLQTRLKTMDAKELQGYLLQILEHSRLQSNMQRLSAFSLLFPSLPDSQCRTCTRCKLLIDPQFSVAGFHSCKVPHQFENARIEYMELCDSYVVQLRCCEETKNISKNVFTDDLFQSDKKRLTIECKFSEYCFQGEHKFKP